MQKVRSHALFGIGDIPPLLSARTPSAPAQSETRPEKKRQPSRHSLALAERTDGRSQVENKVTQRTDWRKGKSITVSRGNDETEKKRFGRSGNRMVLLDVCAPRHVLKRFLK